MEKHKSCSFFGHRNVSISQALIEELEKCIENLIINCDTQVFLFGSRSNFNDICHAIVTKLKGKYPNIKRVVFTCKNENCVLENEKNEMEKIYSYLKNEKVKLLTFEEEFEYVGKYIAGRASYIKRNQAMIDSSNYCIFYYDKNYQPQKRKATKQSVLSYQPKSGTAIAFEYAKQKQKIIINLAKQD